MMWPPRPDKIIRVTPTTAHDTHHPTDCLFPAPMDGGVGGLPCILCFFCTMLRLGLGVRLTPMTQQR